MAKKIDKIGSIAESLGFRTNHQTLSKKTRVYLARSGLLGRRPELFEDGTIENTAQDFVVANGKDLWPSAQRSHALVYPRDEQEIVSKVASIMRLQCRNRIRNKHRPSKIAEKGIWDTDSLPSDYNDGSDFGDEGDINHGPAGDVALVEQDQHGNVNSGGRSAAYKGKAPVRSSSIHSSEQHHNDGQDVTIEAVTVDNIDPRSRRSIHGSAPHTQSQASHEGPEIDIMDLTSTVADGRSLMLKRPVVDEPGPSKRVRFGSSGSNQQSAGKAPAKTQNKEHEQGKDMWTFDIDGVPQSLTLTQSKQLLSNLLSYLRDQKAARKWNAVRSGLADVRETTSKALLDDIVDLMNVVKMMVSHKPEPTPVSIQSLVIVVDPLDSPSMDEKRAMPL